MELEKLLKKLIKRGWKPRWYEDVYKFKLYKWWYTINRPQKQKLISFATETRHYINWTDYIWYRWYSLRELVSKESGLWQFVCENKMQKEHPPYNRDSDTYWFTIQEYQYRLIESALKDESELEKFLLDNIKV